MAALPLTLDTLKSASQESVLSSQSPLISPQCLKSDTMSITSDMDTIPERPSNLTIDSAHQMQKQQQHSNITPSSSTATLHGNISPALSSGGSLSPSFLPEMPQWKRDLIQRRKQNVQRTISASSPTSSSSGLSLSPTTTILAGGGLKTSISSLSVRSLGGSNTNIDQLASDGLQQVCSTKDYTKTSLLSYGNTTSKVNKQYNTTTSTNTLKPATNIKSSTSLSSSPLKERAEKLFGGQYTATSKLTTFSTKEEIATLQQQSQQVKENIKENKMMEENEEECFEMCRKTKEVINDETQTTTAFNTNKQKATRLTGSTYNNTTTTNASTASASSPSSTSTTILKRAETDREKLLNTTQQYHNNIIGANVNLVNQSLNKCESERLVCAANTTGNTFNLNNTNNSVTIGGISVSGNISNSQNNCSNVTNVVKISQKLQENQFIKNEQQLNTKKIVKFKQNTISGGNNISLDLKSPTKISHVLTTSNSTSCLTSSLSSATATSSTNCAIKKKMVAVQEMKKSTQNSSTHLHPITSTCHATNRANNRGGIGGDTDLDSSEDLSYGPGIVSKLRCRYLSLALRESMEQQRLNKDQLRRSTSLNNLLDNTEDEENCEEDEETPEMIDDDLENQSFEYKAIIKDTQSGDGLNNAECTSKKTGILKPTVNNGQDKRFTNNSQGSNGVGVTFTETAYNKRSRHLKRGNDSLKRARSVEALLSEKSPWHTRANCSTPTCVTIEDKIHNARERLQQGSDHMPPKRLTSIIDDTERPPPDLVKQTLKMFEATANRRPRSTNRSNSKGEVASKVETFKNIIKEQKPVVTFPKPSSPTKKMNTPTLHKPLKTSTPQANDLLQSPLGRKTMAAATSVANTSDCLTPLKTNNTLSDHTPDIIPRQKFVTERDFKQKEICSSKEKFLGNERDFESPLNNMKREMCKEKYEVDSPLTALTKELGKLKLNDNTTATRKNDNFGNGSSCCSSDNYDTVNNIGSVGGVGGGDNKSGDACQRHNKYPYNNSKNDFVNEETTQKEFNISSLKNENDKINNKTKSNSNNEATSSSPPSTTIETKNEATVNNYNDSLTKASSPPPSSSDLSDVGENYDDDENGGLKTTKRITRTALDNISKAGYTQQFKFNTTTSQSSSTSSTTTNNSTALTTGKQVGVIRPLLNTQQQQQQQQQKSKESNMETFKHSNITSSLTSREIEKNRINDLKKSSTASGLCNTAAVTSSPSASLDHQVIKPSSPATTSSPALNNSASGFTADVDSVISATNSPLWAMRKRRQTPPAVPAENTSMVFNFSNRKEVPDYIENDGVIFRRKRELPKPNESGFVLLGDLSVETSTDMDYDDFSMCPPSPCDVEFVNANIVIDGKSSIRQKSKDTTFRVQFNDTLTSTYEYPSEASLIVDESFSAYNESYTQPIGSSTSPDDFTHTFQNLNLENATHHHVADEIIQLPTLNSSSPAAAATNTNSPTKNILGNLPLDYPDLQKGIQLATATVLPTQTPNETSPTTTTEDNNEKLQQLDAIDKKKKSRKDLTLPLGLSLQPSLQKPPLPVKRFQMMNPAAVGLPKKLLHSKNLPTNSITYEEAKQQGHHQQQQLVKREQISDNAEVLQGELPSRQRKTPRVLNNPQYACFLQETKNCVTKPIQRSRSNEFQTTFTTLSVSATVSRSNSLRNLEYVPAIRANSQLTPSSAIGATSLCFPTEVNSNDFLTNLSEKEMAKNPNAFKTLPITQSINSAKESPRKFENNCIRINQNKQGEPPELSQSLNNLTENSQNILNLKEKMSRSVDSIEFANLKCFTSLPDQCVKSLDNLEFSTIQENPKENASNQAVKTNKNNSTQKLPLITTSDKPIQLASPVCILNDIKADTLILNRHARVSVENLGDISKTQESKYDVNENVQLENKINSQSKENLNLSSQNSIHHLILIENISTLESQITSDLEDKLLSTTPKDSENQTTTANSTFRNTKTGVGVCLTVNSKYVTDYRSKITKNLTHRELKVKENVKSDENLIPSTQPLKKSIKTNSTEIEYNFPNNSSLEMNKKSSNLVPTTIKQIKSQDILADAPSSFSKEAFDSNQTFCHKNEIFVNSRDKVKDNLALKANFNEKSNSADALNTTNYSKDSSIIRSQSLNDVHIIASNNYLVSDNVGNKIGFDPLEIRTKSKDNFKATSVEKLENIQHNASANDSRSLQISTDSLDQFEDAEDKTEKKSLTDVEASEMRKDIATAPSTNFSPDNCKLLSLKRSKTAYCLRSLENSFSLESQDNDYSLQSDESNFVSACNTLESKCPLKPYKPPEIEVTTSEPSETLETVEEPEVITKRPKTLRIRTAAKIINFTNLASQNISNYATFRKPKSFYKNASKSFKNSLRFYETFSGKPTASSSPQSPTEKSTSFTENHTKKADLNRKIFSKSSKIMRKVRNTEEWESPTENSYSFEYFDAVDGLNGNLVNMNNRENTDNDILIEDNANLGKDVNESNLSNLQDDKQAIAIPNLMLSEKSIHLKPTPSDFYFNTSPRPFKSMYEATTLVNITESSHKPLGQVKCDENFPREDENKLNFENANASNSLSDNPSLFPLSMPTESNHFSSQRPKSFSSCHKKPAWDIHIKKSGSFNTFSKNVYQKVEIFNKTANQINTSRFSKINNNINKLNDNSKFSNDSQALDKSSKSDCLSVGTILPTASLKINTISAQKSNREVEIFMRNNDSTRFSFNLTKFSSSSPRFVDNSPVKKGSTDQTSSISKTLQISKKSCIGNGFTTPVNFSNNSGSAPLGFYTPVKAPIDRLFQLGVTRAPSLLSNDSPTETTANGRLLNGVGNEDDFGDGNGSIVGISGGLLNDDYDEHKKSMNNADDEPESLQYIKPAEDDLNIAYSEGTQKTDLLY